MGEYVEAVVKVIKPKKEDSPYLAVNIGDFLIEEEKENGIDNLTIGKIAERFEISRYLAKELIKAWFDGRFMNLF